MLPAGIRAPKSEAYDDVTAVIRMRRPPLERRVRSALEPKLGLPWEAHMAGALRIVLLLAVSVCNFYRKKHTN